MKANSFILAFLLFFQGVFFYFYNISSERQTYSDCLPLSLKVFFKKVTEKGTARAKQILKGICCRNVSACRGEFTQCKVNVITEYLN